VGLLKRRPYSMDKGTLRKDTSGGVDKRYFLLVRRRYPNYSKAWEEG